jgi:hypothetical protein
MFRAVEAAASKFRTKTPQSPRFSKWPPHMQFVQSCDIPDNVPKTWTNNDYRRACGKLIERLQGII